jgi:hypothetical protein
LIYPIFTFIVNGALIFLIGNRIPGISIASLGTAIWIAIWITVVNAILGALLSLDEDERFDRNVTGPMVKRRGKPVETDVPGWRQ